MVKFVTNASSATWWPKLEPMLIALHVGQIWNQFWWHHLVVKFWTNTSGTTYNWPNLEPMQVAFYLAGEITQVIDSIPWVRCASGNVYITDILGRLLADRWDTRQTSLKCATARPSVIDSEGPSSIIKDPNIRSFVAKSVLARFTRFLGVRTQPLTLKAQTKHCQIGQLHY